MTNGHIQIRHKESDTYAIVKLPNLFSGYFNTLEEAKNARLYDLNKSIFSQLEQMSSNHYKVCLIHNGQQYPLSRTKDFYPEYFI
jgi:hypothetical protein